MWAFSEKRVRRLRETLGMPGIKSAANWDHRNVVRLFMEDGPELNYDRESGRVYPDEPKPPAVPTRGIKIPIPGGFWPK